MALSVLQIKNLPKRRRAYKVTDGKGMYLHVMVSGSKIFRMDYQFEGKRKTLTIGSFDLIPLSEASPTSPIRPIVTS